MDKSSGLLGFSGSSPARFTIGKKGEPEGESAENNPASFLDDRIFKSRTKDKNTDQAFAFSGLLTMLQSPWREMKWTEEQKTTLMNSVRSYKPGCREATEARVLLLGPVGSGKSSFISSVQSVFNGRVTNRAMVGSFSTSFTKKLQFFKIHGLSREQPSGLVLCDTMGLGDGAMMGPSLHDVLSVIKGYVPEGHKVRAGNLRLECSLVNELPLSSELLFRNRCHGNTQHERPSFFFFDQFSPHKPVNASQTVGYVKRPSLMEKIHCVAFVLDASKISTYSKSLNSSFQQLREHISDLGIHQVALLTHIDQICLETARDVTLVYNSRVVHDAINKAAVLLGMSTSYIVPVKNYSSELEVNVNTDILLLSAVDHILQYADLYFHDNSPPNDFEEA